MKTTYKCKKCHWEKSVAQAWSDLKPKMCPAKHCLASFTSNPELLEITVPEVIVAKKEEKQEYKQEVKQPSWKKDKKDNRDE
jgi:hypothetical protein